jgi:hypothetical protein
MATKFSDFTAQAATGTTFVVGYDGTTNTQYSQDNLTNFVLDGTLSTARTLKLDGNNLNINYGTGNVFPTISANKFTLYPNGDSVATSRKAIDLGGNITFAYTGHNSNSIGLNFTGHNTSIRAYGFSFYGGGGFSTNSGYSVIGPNLTYNSGADLNARLGVIGKSATSTTDYAFRVQNSASADMLTVRDDGAITLGKGANSTLSSQVAIGQTADASGSFDIAIGYAADANGGGSVAIGRSTSTSANGIAIGFANSAGANGISMGQSSIATGSGVAIGAGALAPTQSIGLGAYAKGTGANSITLNANGSNVTPSTANAFGVYMTSNTTPDFRVIGAEGMVPPSITTTVRDAISSPVTGSTIYNTTDNKLQFYNASAWTDAAGGDSIYTANGSINEDRTITVGHDSTTHNTYVTSFESSKNSGTSQRNSSGNILQIKESYDNQIPVSYGQTRGAGLKLQAKTSYAGQYAKNAEGYINASIINSGSTDYTNRDQIAFRTNTAFVFKATDTSWPLYFAVQGGPSNNLKTLLYSGKQDGGLLQLKGANAKTTKITLADTSDLPGTNGYYRYISGGNSGSSGKLILGRRLNGQSEEAYITCSGIGNASGNIAIGINQGTPTATLHVTGSGAASGTTSFLVENSSGTDTLSIKDDGAVTILASELNFSNLPTSDPSVEGQLWNDEGTLKISIP